VVTEVRTPTNLTPRQRELLEELAVLEAERTEKG
jgi:DnaJ-class molecular chaperone